MTPVKVRNTVIGEGMPKICVPIVGETKQNIIAEARTLKGTPVDVVEWRVDWFEHGYDFEKVLTVLQELRPILGDLPLLMTFRTSKEGGKRSIEPEDYANLIIAAAESGYVDLVDVEVFTGDEIAKRIINAVHAVNVKVIASNHDFHKTPDKDDIIAKLCKMQDLGADIPKIAVMPQSKKDVLTLLAATEEMATEKADRPIITMSMSGNGVISRLCGELFGSALTFGSIEKTSAPGQMEVNDLVTILQLFHNALCD